jgi:hypothetical protein
MVFIPPTVMVAHSLVAGHTVGGHAETLLVTLIVAGLVLLLTYVFVERSVPDWHSARTETD